MPDEFEPQPTDDNDDEQSYWAEQWQAEVMASSFDRDVEEVTKMLAGGLIN